MARISWISENPRYESGTDRGVYYPSTGPGLAWNGLAGVSESSSDSEGSGRYLDGRRIRNPKPRGYFTGSIQAFTYPETFEQDVLIPRRPKRFGFSYRVTTSRGFKIHLVYNALVDPTQMSYKHLETEAFAWAFTANPVEIPEGSPSAHLIIDSEFAYPKAIESFEDVIYGGPEGPARLPTPTEVFDIFESNAIFVIIDHGDGTWTARGPDSAIEMLDATTFKLNWPSAEYISDDSYSIRSS